MTIADEIEELRETHELDRAFIETQKDAIVKLRAEIERHIREKVELAGLVAKKRDEIERLRVALEAVDSENLLTGQLSELVDAALEGK
jgi:predicted RNase H-like nuclease (RuvC/YqgF family)